MVSGKWHSAKGVKYGHNVISGKSVLGEAEEFKRTVLFEDALELLYSGAAEVVV